VDLQLEARRSGRRKIGEREEPESCGAGPARQLAELNNGEEMGQLEEDEKRLPEIDSAGPESPLKEQWRYAP
jgi:hypothetical protein